MAEKLGINVVFKGETTEFEKAVKSVNNEIRSTKSEIGSLNKQLKLDPKNIELIEKKLNLLKNKQSELTEKVKLYQDAINKLPADKIGTDEWVKLNSELNKAQVELAQLNDELRKTPSAPIQALAKQLEETENRLNKIGQNLENVGKKFLALSGVITGLATAGIKYNAELERQTTLFTTLTGSVTEAERVLNAIKNDAMGSPFDVNSLITANQYLIATGLEADKSRKTILDLGNAISATGGGNSELQRMAQNLQQIQNVGKASSVDMKQFAMAGIDIWGILADSTGKAVKELQEMDITYDMIAEALASASAEGGKYAGAMEAQADTLNGKISMLKATFQELLGELTQTLLPVIKQVLDYLQEWINKLKNLDDSQKQTITKITGIVASIGPLLTIIGKLIGAKGIGGLVGKIKTFITSEKFTIWLFNIAEKVGGVQNLLVILSQTFTKILVPIGLVTTALVLLYNKNENFRNAVNNLVKTISNILTPVLNSLWNLIKTLISIFGEIAKAILNVFISALNSLIKIVGNVLASIVNLVDGLLNKLQPAFDLIKAVINYLVADFNLLKSTISNFISVAISQLKSAFDDSIKKIQSMIDWVKKMFNTFANTSWGNTIISIFEKIGGWVQWCGNLINNLIGDINSATQKTNQLISAQDNASRYARSQARGVVQQFDGSGGLGITANIHVENNGTPIDTAEIRRWVDVIASQVDQQLGRAF